MATPRVPNWQAQILRGVGAPVTSENVKFVNAWAQAEGGSAANNPFNTTQPASGASKYNSVGVRNYGSPQQGIQATIQTLRNGHYGAILQALAKGNSAMADAQAEASTPWGTGALIEKVLGGKVTGGQPTALGAAPGASGLASALMTGNVQTAPQANPVQNLIQLILANNQALMQQPQAAYRPF